MARTDATMQQCNVGGSESFPGRPGCGLGGGGFGITTGSLRGGGILFRRPFVAFTAVIGAVETAAFEKQAGTGANFAFYAPTPPFLLDTLSFRANSQRFGGDRLKGFKLVPALFAKVFVGRHRQFANKSAQHAGRSTRRRIRQRRGQWRNDVDGAVGTDFDVQIVMGWQRGGGDVGGRRARRNQQFGAFLFGGAGVR